MSRSLVAVYVVAALVSGLLVGRFSSLPLPFDKPATPATASEVSVSGDRLTAYERAQLQMECYKNFEYIGTYGNGPSTPGGAMTACLKAVEQIP